MMKGILLLFSITIFLIIQFSLCSLENQTQDDDLKNTFEWKLITQNASGKIKTSQYEDIFKLDSTSKYQIELRLKKKVYLYIYSYDSTEKLSLLFPADFSGAQEYNTSSNYFILPTQNTWFKLPPEVRIKKFYIIASNHRLTDIENMTQTYYELLQQKQKDLNKINHARGYILNSLNNLELDRSYFTSSAKKPLPIAGDVKRKTEDNIIWIE